MITLFPAKKGENVMKKWKHINFEQRKLISHLLTKKAKLCEIAELLGVDASAVSKEIRRNRVLMKESKLTQKVCKVTVRFPYFCNACHKKYTSCPFTQFKYDPKRAQEQSDYRLVHSRTGLNMSKEEYNRLNTTILDGVSDGHSIYHIVKSHPELNTSVPTVYRLINTGKLTTKRMDLPYAVSYKKRKVSKQYEYKENRKIDRSGRTFIDFLAFKHHHPHSIHIQMDFLGSIKADKKSILTMSIPTLHFVMLFLVESPNSSKIIHIFDQLEILLTLKLFNKVFSCVLTDRDPCFSAFDQLETSCLTQTQRTQLFYCDSFNSAQKANVEQMNKQLRKFFPKGKSIDHLTKEEVKEINIIINKSRIASLSGASANEAFVKLFGQTALDKLNTIVI